MIQWLQWRECEGITVYDEIIFIKIVYLIICCSSSNSGDDNDNSKNINQWKKKYH